MLVTAIAIAPIFGIIVLGHLLRRGGIPSFEFWNLNDKLVYWVLMPSLLFHKMSTADFDPSLVGSYAAVVLGAFGAALAAGLILPKLLGYAAPVRSSVLQGAARHNIFIVLAVSERLYGQEGLTLAALGAAMLIPTTNISMVTLMVGMASRPAGSSVLKAILKDLARNPLLLAVALGVAWNVAFDGKPAPVIHDIARILGAASLPVMLMCVGANLRVRAMGVSIGPLALATVAKMIVFPAATIGLALAAGLSELQTMVALLFGASPTASSAYTLARQLGGDAPLMAAIVTLQTAIAFASLPATLYLISIYLF